MSFGRKALQASGGQVVSVALSVSTGMLFSRSLGPDGVGRFDFYRVVLTLAVTLAALGIGSAAIYVINHLRHSVTQVVTSALQIAIPLGLVLSILIGVTARQLPQYFGDISWFLAVTYGLSTGAALVTAVLSPVLVAQFRILLANLAVLIAVAVPLAGGAAAWALGVLDSWLTVILLCVAQFASLALLLFALRHEVKPSLPFNWKIGSVLLKQGIKLAAANLLYMLSLNGGVVLLKAMRGEDFSDVGLYSRAVTIAGLVTIIPRGIGPLLYSRWSQSQGAERNAQVERVARLNTGYAILATATLWFGGRFALRLLFGPDFVEAQDALVLVAPAMGCFVFYDVFNNLLAASARAGVTALVLAGGLAFVLLTSIALIPSLGIRGAGWGILAGNGFIAVSSALACRRIFAIRPTRCLLPTREDLNQLYATLARSKARLT